MWKYPLSDESRRSFAGCAWDGETIAVSIQGLKKLKEVRFHGQPRSDLRLTTNKLMRHPNVSRIGIKCACKLMVDSWSRYIPKVLNEELCRSFFTKIKDTLF